MKQIFLALLVIMQFLAIGDCYAESDIDYTKDGITYELYDTYQYYIHDNHYNWDTPTAVVTDITDSKTSLSPEATVTVDGVEYTVRLILLTSEKANITTVTLPTTITHPRLVDESKKYLPNWQYVLAPNNAYFCESARGKCGLRSSDKKSLLFVAPNGGEDCNSSGIDGIESIEQYAFVDCQFTKLKVPSSVTSIDQNAFSGFSELESFEPYGDNLGIYRAENGVLYKYDGTTSESSVEALASYPDAKTGTFTLKMEDGSIPQTILPYACDDCNFGSGFYIPAVSNAATMTIKERAFYNASMTEFNSDCPIWYINTAAFENTKITAFIAHGGSSYDLLETNARQINIGNNAFLNSTLKQIQFPYGKSYDVAIYIKDYAFCHCENLQTVNFASYTEGSTQSLIGPLGEGAFYYCTKLTGINLSNHKYVPIIFGNNYIFRACTKLATVKLVKNSITTIGDCCFMGCSLDGWWFYNQSESLGHLQKRVDSLAQ